MRRTRRGVAAVAMAMALVAGTSACASNQGAAVQGIAGAQIAVLALPTPPHTVAGLVMRAEDVRKPVSETSKSYISAIGVYGLRAGSVLEATLQVSRFGDHAAYRSAAFRQSLVDGIGSSVAQQVRLGNQLVYLTTGTNQELAIWFADRYFCVLAVRTDFTQPRTLLRHALEIRL